MQSDYKPSRIMRARAVENPELRKLVVRHARQASRTVGRLDVDRLDLPFVLWRYVHDLVPYVEDGDLQSIRRPAALIFGMSGDCKSTAVFIGSLAKAAGADVVIRFAEYPGTPWYSHVYAVVDGTVADPLLEFGAEQPYLRCEDHDL